MRNSCRLRDKREISYAFVYDRDLADLYARLVAREDAAGVYHANDEGDERLNDIVAAIKPYEPVRPDAQHVPLDEARTKMGATPRRCRSIKSSEVHGHVRSAGGRACARSLEMPRGCSSEWRAGYS